MTYTAPRAYPSVADVSSALPTFAVAEVVFLAVAALALAHAWTRPGAHPNGRQRHVLLFVFAIIGGCLSDLFFVSTLYLPSFRPPLSKRDRSPAFVRAPGLLSWCRFFVFFFFFVVVYFFFFVVFFFFRASNYETFSTSSAYLLFSIPLDSPNERREGSGRRRRRRRRRLL